MVWSSSSMVTLSFIMSFSFANIPHGIIEDGGDFIVILCIQVEVGFNFRNESRAFQKDHGLLNRVERVCCAKLQAECGRDIDEVLLFLRDITDFELLHIGQMTGG